jgi:hypothetical protein
VKLPFVKFYKNKEKVNFIQFISLAIYLLFFKRVAIDESEAGKGHAALPPPLEKQDMTVEQLRKYNGLDDPHICVALLGKVFMFLTLLCLKSNCEEKNLPNIF